MNCPYCGSSMFRVVIDSLLVLDMDAERVVNVHSEEVNREGEIICDDCQNKIPETENLWSQIETIHDKPLEVESNVQH